MQKFFAIFTPITILVVSILIMLSGSFFKKPTGDWDNIPKQMDEIHTSIISNNWSLAEQNVNELETAWKSIIKRAQFGIERDEINSLSVSISRLRASIMATDKTLSLIELGEAKQHWNNLGK